MHPSVGPRELMACALAAGNPSVNSTVVDPLYDLAMCAHIKDWRTVRRLS